MGKKNNKKNITSVNKNWIDMEDEEILDNTNKNRFYLGYTSRLIIKTIFLVVLIIAFVYFAINSFSLPEKNVVKYYQSGSSDYKVYLKDNDFYDNDYLNSGMSYVASIINYIDIDFLYSFYVEQNTNLTYDYSINGLLQIKDTKGSVFLEKKYVLLEKLNNKIEDDNNFNIKENIKIDYDLYNGIANEFNNSYGVSTESYLTIYLTVKTNSLENEELQLSETKQLDVMIPLSEKQVNIDLTKNNVNDNNEIVNNSNLKLNKKSNLVIAIIIFVAFLVLAINVIKSLLLMYRGKSEYDKYIGKLLLDYDRLIANTTYLPDFTKNEVININNFNELLDIRDNLKQPIMYYEVVKHHKCYFYIYDNNKIYLVKIKAVDLEKGIK